MKQNVRRKNAQPKKSVREASLTSPLADLFRSARASASKSVESVASDSGVSATMVRLLETAPQKVPLHDVYAVSNALNLDPGVVLELLHSAIR